MASFFETVVEILKQDERFITKDGTLLRNVVYEAAMQMDSSLIHLLYSNAVTKEKFFKDVDGIAVFDKVEFGWVVNNREFLPDSYTRFKNKIGLADEDGNMISASGKVELVFPYKDCVLEGGQTKEDQKRDEVFFNQSLAPDEIDRMMFPKVFSKAKRVSTQGTESVECVSDSDNLIIKGNNLLALSSLLKKYENRIKCIYIDPPYYFAVNKDEDTFEYNSTFKLSTWLVFMKNRLELARRLLRDDGSIFVQISDDGVAELHRLMKDVFNVNGENNFINKITVKTKSPSGFASVNPGVFETAEYILAFAKHKKQWKYNPQYVKSSFDTNYKWFVENITDDASNWKIHDVFDYVAKMKGYENKKQANKILGETAFYDLVGFFALENAKSVFRLTAIGNNAGQEIVAIRDTSKSSPNLIYTICREKHYDVYVKNGQELAFYIKKVREIDGEKVPSIQLSNIWVDTPYEGIASEGDVTLKGGKKPEKLIKRILEMASEKNDLVLDFHLGSGTTCAVAHKLGRRYIGIEQLDSQIQKIESRLKNVVDGDKSGISKLVNWQGGGSFVYCELAKANQKFVDELQDAKTADEIQDIYKRMVNTGFISSKVNPKDIDDNAAEFAALSLDNQKRFLMELLDKNLLYVNYCDIDDEEFAISEEDKAFTRSFYGEK